MRVRQIAVKDFRGFPGPAQYVFDLGDAHHLLLYGENGSGKSSLFRAVEEFFNLDPKAKAFADFKNVFSNPGLTDGNVALALDDGTSFTWSFGGKRETAQPAIGNIAIRLGCIDYRALLRTNFLQEDDAVNLFSIAVRVLLIHHPVSIGGRSTTVGKLWQRVVSNKPKTHHQGNVRRANDAVKDFNEAVNGVLPGLSAKAQELLNGFPGCDFQLVLRYPGLQYDLNARKYIGQELFLDISRNGTAIKGHQHFLNEAKLSAIALAIYLAGLLVSVPPPPPGAPQYPKLLVLDDVLIGLDMSNRIPVLEVLRQHFSDWQILLFTYDKVWYEIVQLQTQDDPAWRCHELFTGESQDGVQIPIQLPCGKGWDYYLGRARQHLAENDERASAVYARAAFEGKLKKYCEKRGVWVKFDRDPRQVSNQSFWDASKKHALEAVKTDAVKTAQLQGLFANVEMYRKIVLNPLSHSAAASIVRAEIQGAIDAVAGLTL